MLFDFDHVGLRLRQMPFQRAADTTAEVRMQHGVRIFLEKKPLGIRQIRSSRALLQIREDLFLQFSFQRRFDFSDAQTADDDGRCEIKVQKNDVHQKSQIQRRDAAL